MKRLIFHQLNDRSTDWHYIWCKRPMQGLFFEHGGTYTEEVGADAVPTGVIDPSGAVVPAGTPRCIDLGEDDDQEGFGILTS